VRPVKITGRQVSLRELESSDAAALHAVYGDPAVCEFMSFTPRTLDQCEAIIAAAQQDVDADPRQVYMLAVSDSSGLLVGACRLGRGEWNSGQVGLALRRDHWSRGEGTEALRLLFQLGFRELGVHRIWGARSPRNLASARLMAAAGMREEGMIRGHVPRHGVWEDSVASSILEDEFDS
jgi:[ribosomal protein S5]-alanine N-acetyltransferase